MARKTSIRYWPSRKGGGYFCVFKGKQRELALGPDDGPTGPTYLSALKEFQAILLDNVEAETKRLVQPVPTVREVLEAYMQHIATRRKQGTLDIRLRYFTSLVNYKPKGAKLAFGERPATDVNHMDVYRFLEHMEIPRHQVRKKMQPGRKPQGWGPGSQRNCVQSLIAGFTWATRSGLIAKNPISGIEKPGSSSRGADTLIGRNREEIEKNHAIILEHTPHPYRPFIQALKDTGARPGEITAATAADFDESIGAIIFKKEGNRRNDRFSHKTATKGKDRVIYLCGETLKTVKQLAITNPTGALFRLRSGKPYQKFHYVSLFSRLQKKLKWDNITCYSYRHTFATELLKSGMDVDTLAELMGNSPLVIRLHYSHLLADKHGLRDKLERFRTAGDTQTREPGSS